MGPDVFRRFKRRDEPRLRLEQSLGAFPIGDGDISPLYVLFGVSNAGRTSASVEEVYIRAGRGEKLEITDELGGDGGGLPREIPSGEAATLWMRAKDLADKLQEAGRTGTPKLKLLAVDSGSHQHTTTFRLRVEEYLRLRGRASRRVAYVTRTAEGS